MYTVIRLYDAVAHISTTAADNKTDFGLAARFSRHRNGCLNKV